jgi:hypothetical protein
MKEEVRRLVFFVVKRETGDSFGMAFKIVLDLAFFHVPNLRHRIR